MINYIGKVMQRTGDAVIEVANSSLVKGASKLGTGILKAGVEAGAWTLNKGINGARAAAPKLKNVSGKKINDGIGKVVNKTMVGGDGDYKTLGKIVNNSKIGQAVNNRVGTNVISDELTPRLGKTRYVASGSTFGLADAVTDRMKTVVDAAADVVFGRDIKINGEKVFNTGLIKSAPDYSILGVKTTALGTTLAIGAGLASGVPEAATTLNKNRQGTNFDSQPTSLAPQIPAYSNNGGATGDLVFALNNLRHGGMM